ncbi:HutD family protein [Clostridium chromiireducens]|uniref:HutD family protein n=1 Tax=Clostridium chromiireducens TaxID=225345 RepID=UPI003AF740E0
MKYEIELILQDKFKPTFWSGGIATELITYPLNSDYASRNFLWRLGVAKIDISESTFSNLPNVSRKFMVTEGQITLNHEGKYNKLLKPFDQDSFMGDWTTTTAGKASVFNLMTRENYSGELIHLNIPPNNYIDFKYNTLPNKDLVYICFYVVDGSFKSDVDSKNFELNSKDLLLLNNVKLNSIHEFTLWNNSSKATNIIVSIIYHK